MNRIGIATLTFGLLLVWPSELAIADDEPAQVGPTIPKIEVKNGTALDVIDQIRKSLPGDGPAGFSVELSDDELRSMQVPLLEVRTVPLGLALRYLREATRGFDVTNEGGLWVIRKLSSGQASGGLESASYEVSLNELTSIGLIQQPDGEFKTEAGSVWPGEESSSAQYFTANSTLLLRATEDYHRDLEAILRLTRRGYKDLKLKR